MKQTMFLILLMVVSACGLLYGCAATDGQGSAPVRVDSADLKPELSLISPYITAGRDARFSITITSPSGLGLNPGMLDPGCFRILPESGKILTPAAEGLKSLPLSLGSEAAISRILDLKEALKGMQTQDLVVWWEFGALQTEKISTRVYAWDLAEIEAVIQTNKGDMVVTFYPHKAPITVKNFVDLCMKGFYDGLTFHRIVSGFMIQGGCPIGDGTGDPGYLIAGEFSDVSHERGVISMARSEDPDSAGCQFFIMHQDNPGLDGLYAAFGKLVSGYDTLDRLAEVETQHQRSSDEKSRPAERLVIEKIFIRPGKTTSKSAESGSPDLNGEQQ